MPACKGLLLVWQGLSGSGKLYGVCVSGHGHTVHVRVVYLDNVPVNGDLAQIRRHVVCGDEFHFSSIKFRSSSVT